MAWKPINLQWTSDFLFPQLFILSPDFLHTVALFEHHFEHHSFTSFSLLSSNFIYINLIITVLILLLLSILPICPKSQRVIFITEKLFSLLLICITFYVIISLFLTSTVVACSCTQNDFIGRAQSCYPL